MAVKTSNPGTIPVHLTVSERVLLFCLATETDWTVAGVPQSTVRHMRDPNLVDRDQAARPARGPRPALDIAADLYVVNRPRPGCKPLSPVNAAPRSAVVRCAEED